MFSIHFVNIKQRDVFLIFHTVYCDFYIKSLPLFKNKMRAIYFLQQKGGFFYNLLANFSI